METTYDVVIVGSGPAGYESALRARELGMTAALVENVELGGTCLNRGCIPTKALLHSSSLWRESANNGRLGITAENRAFDIGAMAARKNEVVNLMRAGLERTVASSGIAIIRGRAVVRGTGIVDVACDTGADEIVSLHSKSILLAAGSKPFLPPVPGIDLPRVFTSDSLLRLVPSLKNPIIVGGGAIGVEFASFYNDLGGKVTVVETMERILPLMDREISQTISMILKRRGVNIVTGKKLSSIAEKGNDGDTLLCELSDGSVLESDGVLVATGRRPSVEGLFADGLAVACDRGAIIVDEHFMTGIEGVYAVGDAIGGIQLAHAATAQGIAAVEHMAGIESSYRDRPVPSCVYTNPEIASVGLDSDAAAARGIKTVVGKTLSSMNARAVINMEDRGFAKLVFEETGNKTAGRILGAQIMCSRASDLVSELSTSISFGFSARDIASVIRPHPSWSELITQAARSALSSCPPPLSVK